MLFNSFEFLLFYITVVTIFFSIPHRFRWILLLAASYYFYMSWKAEYVILIVFSTIIDYIIGLKIDRSESESARRLLLTISIVANIGKLMAFKYWNFFSQTTNAVLASFSIQYEMPMSEFLLPVGISFYSFQSLSYTIDVYRRKTPSEKHLGIYAVYVAFFPQLVAGPIERSNRLLPQFKVRQMFSYDRLTSGLRIILWGLIKKVVIADQLAIVVDTVYANPSHYSGPFLALATLFFTVQIYCDFSAYSDIAIGTARIMGFDLMTNFERPYLATSLRDFWRRWHISLMTWFRDYLYIPLGGNRVSSFRKKINIMIVFFISGLWHGAAWTFILWGGIHGILLVGESVFSRRNTEGFIGNANAGKLRVRYKILKRLMVFTIVFFAWILFRAQTLDDAIYIFTHFFSLKDFSLWTLWRLGLPRFEMMIAFLGIGVLAVVDWLQEENPYYFSLIWAKRSIRWAVYIAGLYAIVFFGVFGQVEFIYFQF